MHDIERCGLMIALFTIDISCEQLLSFNPKKVLPSVYLFYLALGPSASDENQDKWGQKVKERTRNLLKRINTLTLLETL